MAYTVEYTLAHWGAGDEKTISLSLSTSLALDRVFSKMETGLYLQVGKGVNRATSSKPLLFEFPILSGYTWTYNGLRLGAGFFDQFCLYREYTVPKQKNSLIQKKPNKRFMQCAIWEIAMH